ncbi:hypothetical protein HanXRQr2_Chr16g0730081 [Helianthus annuus]|uniref:Uncharacterized protein n=1 Tax=Helianthus annuus TaxID=4232 RepID=A0A9K3GYR2_HELAN|nr:hypothetical protein HanXRQr2_Chr16g0730081 [Helianthus annuus]KAJ0639704.1 hypothetical protein HanLR1_Chr16g0606761 [Helianthus annuus]KAJ0643653.1 hypothetical protein HanOQP8_Chr16g0602931 [Helianthus annuus]
MSCERCSSGARGRRRGPVARPRGSPTQEQQVVSQRKGRRIRYEGPKWLIYAWCPLRREHPLLQFQVNTNEWIKLQKIIRRYLLKHWTIDWEWLGQMGARERVEELLGPMLVEMVNCDWPQYDELVVEFHSTFHHREGSFFEGDTVSFSLGRMLHVMSILEFAIASGFFAFEDTSTEEFTNGLRGVYVNPRELCVTSAELARFWGTIVDRGFGHAGEEKRAALDMGPYITKLAHNLGVFQKYNVNTLRRGPASRHFDVKDLQLAGIVSMTEPVTWVDARQGPQVMPPAGYPADDVMQAIYPPARQVPRQRQEIPAPQYPRCQAPPDPLTLASLYERIDAGFCRMDYRPDRQDGAIRVMTTVMKRWKKRRRLRAMTKISVGITTCRERFGVWCVMPLPFACVS